MQKEVRYCISWYVTGATVRGTYIVVLLRDATGWIMELGLPKCRCACRSVEPHEPLLSLAATACAWATFTTTAIERHISLLEGSFRDAGFEAPLIVRVLVTPLTITTSAASNWISAPQALQLAYIHSRLRTLGLWIHDSTNRRDRNTCRGGEGVGHTPSCQKWRQAVPSVSDRTGNFPTTMELAGPRRTGQRI